MCRVRFLEELGLTGVAHGATWGHDSVVVVERSQIVRKHLHALADGVPNSAVFLSFELRPFWHGMCSTHGRSVDVRSDARLSRGEHLRLLGSMNSSDTPRNYDLPLSWPGLRPTVVAGPSSFLSRAELERSTLRYRREEWSRFWVS